MHVVKATGWPAGAKPVAAEGTAVAAFVAIDKRGALLMADDLGNVIWWVTSAASR